jgi:hypothetical protein
MNCDGTESGTAAQYRSSLAVKKQTHKIARRRSASRQIGTSADRHVGRSASRHVGKSARKVAARPFDSHSTKGRQHMRDLAILSCPCSASRCESLWYCQAVVICPAGRVRDPRTILSSSSNYRMNGGLSQTFDISRDALRARVANVLSSIGGWSEFHKHVGR